MRNAVSGRSLRPADGRDDFYITPLQGYLKTQKESFTPPFFILHSVFCGQSDGYTTLGTKFGAEHTHCM
jgi:hypothetical protein